MQSERKNRLRGFFAQTKNSPSGVASSPSTALSAAALRPIATRDSIRTTSPAYTRSRRAVFSTTMRISGACSMAPCEFGDHAREREILDLEQHQRVVEKIGRFCNDFLVGLRDAGERQLEPFFSDLLRDANDPLIEELCRIAARRPLRDTRANHGLQLAEKRQILGGRARRRRTPAGRCIQMAGRTLWRREDQQRVAVAVG